MNEYEREPRTYSEEQEIYESKWSEATEEGERKKQDGQERETEHIDCKHPQYCGFPKCQCL